MREIIKARPSISFSQKHGGMYKMIDANENIHFYTEREFVLLSFLGVDFTKLECDNKHPLGRLKDEKTI